MSAVACTRRAPLPCPAPCAAPSGHQAFALELGSTGVAFKSTPRLDDPMAAGMKAAYAEKRVIVARDPSRAPGAGPGAIMGVVAWELHDDGRTMEFGKLSVSKAHQRKGVGQLSCAHAHGGVEAPPAPWALGGAATSVVRCCSCGSPVRACFAA